MKIYKKVIPNEYVFTIRDIDYNKLKEQGIKALFFDLDNTIIPYDVNVISDVDKAFLEELNKEFKVLVISNSRKKRVSTATKPLEGIPYVKFARKPLKFGFKKGLKLLNVKPSEVCIIGDQVMTDILGANRLKAKYSILVKPVKQRSDHILTRFNRRVERYLLKKAKRKMPEVYEKVFENYEGK